MTTTAEHVAALESALGSGELSVQFGDRRVTYRSAADLREALSYFQAKAAREAGATGGPVVSIASYHRG